MKKRLKKIGKITLLLVVLLLIVLIALFYQFSTPKATHKIEKEFEKLSFPISLSLKTYQKYKYRVLELQKKIDTTLPTIVFIHGSIGSILDFKKYLMDEELNSRVNLISYDRIGYGIYHTGNVQESIQFETNLLEDLIKNIPSKKVILVGYSYGGPIALASKKKYKKIILLAPAVFSNKEVMPWALNFYKWKLTKNLIPKTWQAASKEKLSHQKDLEKFENSWNENPSTILSIHGNDDGIVPYENSLYLKNNISPQQFELVTLDGVGHGLVWSNFKQIKSILLQQIN
ncbi:alpha/beta hydrolase [uncultured Lutibacter sp.]|uniref:alpha/beta fold hydrolase n=1 Tax=uncultured Lutibacter sp. TaxID=437739 RepID=UPI0026038AE1|nr:alpha/beta hydrolase [uncultured Lutibacter sp.]